jgi:hypothetical protein
VQRAAGTYFLDSEAALGVAPGVEVRRWLAAPAPAPALPCLLRRGKGGCLWHRRSPCSQPPLTRPNPTALQLLSGFRQSINACQAGLTIALDLAARAFVAPARLLTLVSQLLGMTSPAALAEAQLTEQQLALLGRVRRQRCCSVPAPGPLAARLALARWRDCRLWH